MQTRRETNEREKKAMATAVSGNVHSYEQAKQAVDERVGVTVRQTSVWPSSAGKS